MVEEEEYKTMMSRSLPVLDPVADLGDFAKRSESMRQQAISTVEQARASQPQFIDYSNPVQLDTSPPSTSSSAQSPQKDIVLDGGGTGGSASSQDWFVSATGSNESGVKTWLMKGGKVYDANAGAVITVPDTSFSGDSGEIYLLMERDMDTRAIIEVTPTLDAETPESFNQLQYKRIARLEPVTLEGAELPSFVRPVQIQFGDIILFEDLVVKNGSFELATLALGVGNTYAP
jgi:hypothetical protein